MLSSILEKYGIDANLPQTSILQQIKDKNLELLERIGNCSDSQRLTQLQTDQQELEDALLQFSSAVSLERQIETQNAQPSQSATAADPLQAAMLNYQAGKYDDALPVLEDHAKQGDGLCCILTANIYLAQDEPKKAKEYLYTAATAGNATAALRLAQQYRQEDTVNSLNLAIKWAKTAAEQKEPGSWRFLSSLYIKDGQPEQALRARLEELDTATGYDRRAVLVDLANQLRQNPITPGATKQIIALVNQRLEGDALNGEYWTNQIKEFTADTSPAKRSKRSWLAVLSWVLALIPAGISASIYYLFPLVNFRAYMAVWDYMGSDNWMFWGPTIAFFILCTLFRLIFKKHRIQRIAFAVVKAIIAYVALSAYFSMAFDSHWWELLTLVGIGLEGVLSWLLLSVGERD